MIELGVALILAAIGTIARVAIGLMFVTAGLGKLCSRGEFVGVVANYRILPAKFVPIVAHALPIVEIVVGTALITGLATIWAVGIAIALLLGFALAMGINLARGRTAIDCGCNLGGSAQYLSHRLVVRNMVMAALALFALITHPGMVGSLLASCMGAGLLMFLLAQLFDNIRALSTQMRPSGRAAWTKNQ